MHSSFRCLSILVLLVASCSAPTRPTPEPGAVPHVGDAWFEFRAQSLNITREAARARDAALSEDSVPDGVWDRTTQQEAVMLWQSQCAPCHGLTGHGEGAPKLDPAPRSFGTMGMRMGFLFGRDKMRVGLYRKISEGGAAKTPPGPMPAFSATLSREQRWALVTYIESL